MLIRPRRLRSQPYLRDLVQETYLKPNHFIAPLFVKEGTSQKEAISSMPGVYRLSLDLLLKEVEELRQVGVQTIALFPVVENHLKDAKASEALNPNNLNARAMRAIKEKFPETIIMADVALDPYSSDGHDGIVDHKTGKILNDPTLEVLQKMSLVHARAGADIIGPSDMMDGRVRSIREALEEEGFHETVIMSYTAKYASAFYGPFRDALDSAPKFGDKKTYQMNPANIREALREAVLDEEEGADILMVKPGLPYLDVVKALKDSTHLPIAAYNVSGEYAMIKAAGERGWIDENRAMLEMLLSFRRAGADMILTYFAKQAARLLNETKF